MEIGRGNMKTTHSERLLQRFMKDIMQEARAELLRKLSYETLGMVLTDLLGDEPTEVTPLARQVIDARVELLLENSPGRDEELYGYSTTLGHYDERARELLAKDDLEACAEYVAYMDR